MFFILSKLLSFLLQPFFWVFITLLSILIVKRIDLKIKLLKISVVMILLFSNTVIFLEFARLWEVDGQEIGSVVQHDVGIVLGGMTEYNNDFDRLSIRRGGDRIWQAIQLYKLGKIKKILISGANGHLIDKGLQESIQLKKDLVILGIPEEDIITECISKNTYENAIESRNVLAQLNTKPSVLLITSAMHMKRAKACFVSAGFEDIGVFTTDHYTGLTRGYQFDQYIVPNVSTFTNWNSLIKEWVGYLVYKMVGYI